MLNFVDLARQLVPIVVAFGYGLVKLVVGFLHLSDSLRGGNQVFSQLRLDGVTCGVDDSDVSKLLVVVSAAFFLLGVYLPDNRTYLLRKLIPQLNEVEFFPRLRGSFPQLPINLVPRRYKNRESEIGD